MILIQKQQSKTTCDEMRAVLFRPKYVGYYFIAKIHLTMKFQYNSSNIYLIICSFPAILVSLASGNTACCVFIIP
jgi:hypothetical protein